MTARPTDAEFDELKRKRDDGLRELARRVTIEMGGNPDEVSFHAREYASECYCACPDGPCQHIWNGKEYISEDGCMSSSTCSRCGEVAFYHSLRCAP